MESLFVVAKIIGSPCKMIAYFFIQNCLKCAYDHYKVWVTISVLLTITALLHLAMSDFVIKECAVFVN